MSERIALLVVALGVMLTVMPGCRKKPEVPDVEEQQTPSAAVREEVVRGPSGIEVKPELIPLETTSSYAPAEGNPGKVPRTAPQPAGADTPASRPLRRLDPAALQRAIDQVSERSSCNPVMGCPAEREILSAGSAAVQPLIERYGKLERPGYQKFHVIEMLGRLKDPTAVPFLVEHLADTHWQARTHAAMALGRIGATEHLARLQELLEQTPRDKDAGFRYGLAFAVEKLSGRGGRPLLLEALAPDKVGSTNWGYTRVAVEALAELGDKDACPLLPACIEHNDVFLKKEAVRAAAVLECRQDPVLDALATQLDSRIPSVRRAAREALHKLIGMQLTTKSQFDKWKAGK